MDQDLFDDSSISAQAWYELEFLEDLLTDEDLVEIERIEQTYNSKGGKTFECSLCVTKFKKYEDLRQHKDLLHPVRVPRSPGKI